MGALGALLYRSNERKETEIEQLIYFYLWPSNSWQEILQLEHQKIFVARDGVNKKVNNKTMQEYRS